MCRRFLFFFLSIFLKHCRTRIDVKPFLKSQLAKVVVSDVALLLLIEVVEHSELVVEVYFHLENFQAFAEFVERDSIVEIGVEEAESFSERLEFFVHAEPDQLHVSF